VRPPSPASSSAPTTRRPLTLSPSPPAVIQLQGDQRQKIMEMLIEEGIGKETIKYVSFP
jgi:translation initiation factor 1 (eIF-1/SUI1)